MIEPIPVDPDGFFDFIGGPGLTVVFVSVHPIHSFNVALGQRLGQSAAVDQPVALGSMDLSTLLLSGSMVLPFLHRELETCGAPVGLGVVAGYCLFRRGEMLAWDSGLPTLADAGVIARSALLGGVWSGITRNLAYVGQAVRRAADEVAAQRMALAFRLASAEPAARRPASSSAWSSSSRSTSASSGATADNDLFWAYRALGVSPLASDADVHEAWRKCRLQNHPDHAAHDPAEFQRRSRLAADINRAREIILEHRRGKRATA